MYPIRVTNILESHISISFALRPAVFKIQTTLRQVHWMPPKKPLNSTRSNVPHLCETSILESQIWVAFTLRSPRFWDTGYYQTNAPNDPKMIPHICVTSIPESHISLSFALRPAIFKILHILRSPFTTMLNVPKKRTKKKKKKMPKIQNFKCHYSFNKFALETLPRSIHELCGANLVCSFRGKKIDKNQKFSNFTILWTTLVETLPRRMNDVLGVNLMCTFRGYVVWIALPIWSHVNENAKKIVKKKTPKFWKTNKKWSGDVVDRYLSP